MGKFYSDDFAANEPLPSGSRSSTSSSVTVGSVFHILILCLLVATVFRMLARGTAGSGFYVDFESLFTRLSGAPTISTDWISFISTNFGETFPYGFQWIGSAIDFIVDCFAGIMFSSVAVSNALVFVFYFVRWLLL